jgi:hypothetical protein
VNSVTLDTPEPIPGLHGALWVWTQPTVAGPPRGVLELPAVDDEGTAVELVWLGGRVWLWRTQDGRPLRMLAPARA